MGHFVVLHKLLLILVWLATTSALDSSIALAGCQDKCGNISVPYPFGFGNQNCYRKGFNLTCNNSQLFTENDMGVYMEVFNISLEGQLRVSSPVTKDCYNVSGYRFYQTPGLQSVSNTPFTFSDTENRFTALGCDTQGTLRGTSTFFTSGCSMFSMTESDVISGQCTGIGCCQTSIPKGLLQFVILVNSSDFHSNVFNFNPCGYAFLVDKNWYNFSKSDLMNFTNQVPIVLDWAISWSTKNETCDEAKKDPNAYACGNNTVCGASKNEVGYSCNCSSGYQGNPYLQDGCQDINECADPNTNLCSYHSLCINLPGNYSCSCPHDYEGDGWKNGTGCLSKQFPVIQVTVGTGSGFVFLLIGSLLVLWAHHQRRISKLRESYFKQNGGLLLKQQLSSYQGSTESAKIFTAEELKKATNNYAESQILGRGGYGTVYKGILLDQRTVAIKKSKVVDESQIDQFINEVVILSQTNHRNVVKLLGCCLETEVPLLVYEFVTNQTLFHHIHGEGSKSSISWENRLRMATETAEALAYLHSAALPPIIHRDIKSANILLDDNFTAKVSDFGASRLIPVDKTQLSTLVQGTLGYLDPEYFHSSQLTDKSDVYSFGVVLVELLTGKIALSFDRPENERNLAMHFVTSMEENSVWEILEHRVVQEGMKEQIQEVMELARRCLRLKGEERPKMKEVAMELESLRRYKKHPWASQNSEEVECLLLGEPLDLGSHNSIGYDSSRGQAIIQLVSHDHLR
ncbi:wall-associated receptor kinase 2-like [Telopea speciosissima]|uniref:wall-associated receptor kinase 2-like n=1 Tax=Telopea speciosissima TaxID=54955 RepID=UPI001CC63EAD|nr:wall-associated receptor kinase 2-like [Telopea speciosissima]